MRLFEDENERAMLQGILDSWLGTPYKHFNAVKGGGVDCTLFVGKALEEAGILKRLEYQYYGRDWFLHIERELMLNYINYHVQNLLAEGVTVESLPSDAQLYYGDILCLKQDKALAANHAVFYVGDGEIIHAYRKAGVVRSKLSDLTHSSIVRIYRFNRR